MNKRRSQRWRTFRLSTLFGSISVACALFAALHYDMQEHQAEEAAIERLSRFNCEYQWACLSPRVPEALAPVLYSWCTPVLRVCTLEITDQTFRDADVPLLDPFPQLRRLTINNCGLTDDGLAKLASSQRESLYRLHLDDLPITDRGIHRAGILSNLVDLSLCGTDVTDECLGDLATYPDLEHLDLSFTSITDDGLKVIAQMPNLRFVDLRSTDVSDEALDAFQRSSRPSRKN